jgi:hypothetical protein
MPTAIEELEQWAADIAAYLKTEGEDDEFGFVNELER